MATTGRLRIAEQSYFWLGVERTTLAHGTVVAGEQMFVSYQVPEEQSHPVPIVLVHGGGGQSTDYLCRPDGRPGWATLLVDAGYAVYVVDRPGLGRSPLYPELLGPMGPMPTYEMLMSLFTAPEKAERPLPNAHLHTRWPGSGQIGDPALDAQAASSGPSMADLPRSHELWRKRGRELLERIGPAVLITHSAGGPFGWLVADECPELVRGIVAVEPAGPPFSSFGPGPGLVWGLTAAPLHFEPPAAAPSELELVEVEGEGEGSSRLQAEPARQLARLAGIPIAVVTSEASRFAYSDPATVAFLAQAGCDVTHVRLADCGVHGNGHFMMMEENAEEALRPILEFLEERVERSERRQGSAGVLEAVQPRESPRAARAHPPLVLADQGHFWTGVERRQQDGGTVAYGPMFVQYQVPAEQRHPYPFVLVHGGGGQGLAFLGRGGEPGWNEELLWAGWASFVVDRPGHGRAPYHPSVLGEWLPPAAYEPTVGLFEEAAGPGGQWSGSGTIGDPAVDEFFAQQGPTFADTAQARALERSRGSELLERIGPAVILTHSAGGPFGWLVAEERPDLVRAIVAVEAVGMAFAGGGFSNLAKVPIAVVTAERSRLRERALATVAELRQVGCSVTHLDLPALGIFGNGHFMLLEKNRAQVLRAILDWVETTVGA